MIVTSSTSGTTCSPWVPEHDYRLRETVIQGLGRSGYSPLSNIKCEVVDGLVVVFGVVPSFFLKQMAQTIILRIGQIKIKNNLTVQDSHCEPESSDPNGQDSPLTEDLDRKLNDAILARCRYTEHLVFGFPKKVEMR
jgi:hypothetical protein